MGIFWLLWKLKVCFKGGAAPLDPPLLRRALAAHAAEGGMTKLRVLSILTGFYSTLELVYRVVPGFCHTLTFEKIYNGQTHSCYYIKKSKCFLKKFSFKCFFCYGLKLYDFLNVIIFLLQKLHLSNFFLSWAQGARKKK